MQPQQNKCVISSSDAAPCSACGISPSSPPAPYSPVSAAPAAAAPPAAAAAPHPAGAFARGEPAADGAAATGTAAAAGGGGGWKEGGMQKQLLSPEWVHERTGKRIEYFEVQQLTRLEKKERDAIRQHIGREIRDKCRAELDDYYDCMVDRSLTFLACKSYAQVLQRCVKKYEQPEVLEKRWKEVKEERERLGLDGIRRHSRKQYNKYVTDADGTGWLPKRKIPQEQSSAPPSRT